MKSTNRCKRTIELKKTNEPSNQQSKVCIDLIQNTVTKQRITFREISHGFLHPLEI